MYLHLQGGQTVAPQVPLDRLSDMERTGIDKGALGYCKSHALLYLKLALTSCPVGLMKCRAHGVPFCDGSGISNPGLFESEEHRDFLCQECEESN